jgi:hypothetical protein
MTGWDPHCLGVYSFVKKTLDPGFRRDDDLEVLRWHEVWKVS